MYIKYFILNWYMVFLINSVLNWYTVYWYTVYLMCTELIYSEVICDGCKKLLYPESWWEISFIWKQQSAVDKFYKMRKKIWSQDFRVSRSNLFLPLQFLIFAQFWQSGVCTTCYHCTFGIVLSQNFQLMKSMLHVNDTYVSKASCYI